MLRTLRLIPTFTLAAAAALTLGCRDSGGGDDDQPDARIDGSGTGLTIQEVQNDAMVPGTPVDLRRKVVLAIDTFGSRVGNFWVGEEAGGPFSGVLVFGGPVEQVALLAVGDLVDITGAEKTEFALTADTSGRTTTELQPLSGGAMTVTKVGTGTVPAPQVVDALAIGRMDQAGRDAEWEKWEGVLVRVDNASVTQGIRQISGTNPDPTFREFAITGAARVDSSLSAIPSAADGGGAMDLVRAGDCVASITGIGDYFFNYKVLPRMTAEIVTGGTGCPAPETGATACGDSIDNDGNGFADCADFSCQTLPQCTTSTTVEMIQTGAVPNNAVVALQNVVVTGRTFNDSSVWVADAAQAAPNKGILVFRPGSAPDLPAEIDVGAVINVTGTVSEFNNDAVGLSVTEVAGNPTLTLVSATGPATVPVSGLSVATLMNDTTAEPYEGVLVQLQNVRITGSLNTENGTRPMTDGTTAFLADDDIFRLTEGDTQCYSAIIGLWHYNAFDNRWVFVPRDKPGDRTTGTACP